MHRLTRFVVAASAVFVLLGFCSAPARAQVVPPWLPGVSVKLLVRALEFRDVVREEILERLDRYPIRYPRPLPTPPVILPVIEPGLAPKPAAAPRSPLGETLAP